MYILYVVDSIYCRIKDFRVLRPKVRPRYHPNGNPPLGQIGSKNSDQETTLYIYVLVIRKDFIFQNISNPLSQPRCNYEEKVWVDFGLLISFTCLETIEK